MLRGFVRFARLAGVPAGGAPSAFLLAAGLALFAGPALAQDLPDAARGHLLIVVHGETVTVRALDVPVKDVIQEIARRSGVRIQVEGRLDERVTLALERVPLPEAWRRILGNRNFAMHIVDPLGARPAALWVLAKGSPAAAGSGSLASSRGLAETAPLSDRDPKVRRDAVYDLIAGRGAEASEQLTGAALFDDAPSVREAALLGLAEIAGVAAIPVVERALVDPDRTVRAAAIEAAADIGGDDAARALAFALHDEDPVLREQAVYALGEIGGPFALLGLQQALADELSFVRDAAADVLDEMSRD